MDTKTGRECSDWKAWHDNQPPGPAKLYITGKCTFPTSGYSVELKRHEPPGFNPKIYILDKIVHKPSKPGGDVITVVEARYEEKTNVHYEEIHILPDNAHVKVEEVH